MQDHLLYIWVQVPAEWYTKCLVYVGHSSPPSSVADKQGSKRASTAHIQM